MGVPCWPSGVWRACGSEVGRTFNVSLHDLDLYQEMMGTSSFPLGASPPRPAMRGGRGLRSHYRPFKRSTSSSTWYLTLVHLAIGPPRLRFGGLRTKVHGSDDDIPSQNTRNEGETIFLPSGEIGRWNVRGSRGKETRGWLI